VQQLWDSVHKCLPSFFLIATNGCCPNHDKKANVANLAVPKVQMLNCRVSKIVLSGSCADAVPPQGCNILSVCVTFSDGLIQWKCSIDTHDKIQTGALVCDALSVWAEHNSKNWATLPWQKIIWKTAHVLELHRMGMHYFYPNMQADSGTASIWCS
jgi:hypothetical protein